MVDDELPEVPPAVGGSGQTGIGKVVVAVTAFVSLLFALGIVALLYKPSEEAVDGDASGNEVRTSQAMSNSVSSSGRSVSELTADDALEEEQRRYEDQMRQRAAQPSVPK